MKTKLLKYALFGLLAVVLISCKKEEKTNAELLEGFWIVDRGLHLPPGEPNFYVQNTVKITNNEWHQLDLEEAYPIIIIGDTLFLNEFGYLKTFVIEELTENHFKLVFTDYNYSTTPVSTYVGSR